MNFFNKKVLVDRTNDVLRQNLLKQTQKVGLQIHIQHVRSRYPYPFAIYSLDCNFVKPTVEPHVKLHRTIKCDFAIKILSSVFGNVSNIPDLNALYKSYTWKLYWKTWNAILIRPLVPELTMFLCSQYFIILNDCNMHYVCEEDSKTELSEKCGRHCPKSKAIEVLLWKRAVGQATLSGQTRNDVCLR